MAKSLRLGSDMANWDNRDWRALHNLTASTSRKMTQRIGTSTGSVPLDEFVIPGVGEPPVRMFQLLIGLFLLLAGPVALMILKRTENMQFLFCCDSIIVGRVLRFSFYLCFAGRRFAKMGQVANLYNA